MINHTCDAHGRGSQEAEYCYCEQCLENIKAEAYEEGRQVGLKEAQE